MKSTSTFVLWHLKKTILTLVLRRSSKFSTGKAKHVHTKILKQGQTHPNCLDAFTKWLFVFLCMCVINCSKKRRKKKNWDNVQEKWELPIQALCVTNWEWIKKVWLNKEILLLLKCMTLAVLLAKVYVSNIFYHTPGCYVPFWIKTSHMYNTAE